MTKKKKPARKNAKRPARLRFDMSTWELGDWPYELARGVKLKVEDNSKYRLGPTIEIEFDFEELARKIAGEAIEAFFDWRNDTCRMELTEAGIVIKDDNLSRDVTLNLDHLRLAAKGPAADKKVLAVWRARLDELEKERDEEYAGEP